jgi:hypothetical protein
MSLHKVVEREGQGGAIRTVREAGYEHSIILVSSDDNTALMSAIAVLVELICAESSRKMVVRRAGCGLVCIAVSLDNAE